MVEGFQYDDHDSWTTKIFKLSFFFHGNQNKLYYYSKIYIAIWQAIIVLSSSTFDSTTTTINFKVIHGSSLMPSSFSLPHWFFFTKLSSFDGKWKLSNFCQWIFFKIIKWSICMCFHWQNNLRDRLSFLKVAALN